MPLTDTHQSVLILGASGRTGVACIEQLAKQPSNPAIHAFCRDAFKIPDQIRAMCTSLYEGNARNPADIAAALKQSNATWVIVSIGNGDCVAKSNVRQVTAQAMVDVLNKPQFQHVRVVVVSAIGAGTSKIVVGMGIGKLISFHLRHVLADHTQQEATFQAISNRTTVVRPTGLTNHAATGKLEEFGDECKCPTAKADRADLAEWITQEICRGGKARTVNLTSVMQ